MIWSLIGVNSEGMTDQAARERPWAEKWLLRMKGHWFFDWALAYYVKIRVGSNRLLRHPQHANNQQEVSFAV